MRQDSVRINFAYIKATEGLIRTDPYFSHNWNGCKQVKITRGAYHYFKARFSGRLQADFFVKNIAVLRGDLPPVVDVEELDGTSAEDMRQSLNDFLKEITRLTNTKAVIYTNLKFYYNNLAGYYEDYPLWLSNFDNAKPNVAAGTKWMFWQHSNHARVSGILSPVDFDAFNGDSVAFSKILVK